MIPISMAGYAVGLVEHSSRMPMRAEGMNELFSAPFAEFHELARVLCDNVLTLPPLVNTCTR
jgi:hypothetical protein